MKRDPIAVLIAGLFAANAFAQAPDEKSELTGSISLGVRRVNINTNDPSKFTEYRDLDKGITGFGGFELRHRGDTDYFNAYGENVGRDDQYLDLNGGRYGNYKFRLYSDDLKHNFGSGPGALSPYSGIGTNVLTSPTTLPNTNVATWNQFDHSYKRRDWGGMFELQSTSPWYLRTEYNEVQRKGINVFAGANGTSPGNGFTDLPAPIDYTTRNYFLEGGYSGGRSHFAANFLYSTFDNGNDVLRWQNPFFNNGMDTTVLPASNEMMRIGANGNIRRLPLDSTLAGRFTWSQVRDNVGVQQTILGSSLASGNVHLTSPNEPNFHGDIRKTTFSLSLASHPLRTVDTRLYWNYANDANHSTEMTFNPNVGTGLRLGSTNPLVNCANVVGVLCSAELFHQKKNTIGGEANYRLTRENRLTGGAEYTHSEQERPDFPKTNERRFFGEWKSSSLDWVTTRVRYQHLNRRSTFDDQAFETFAANPIDLYVRRFDLANVNQNLLKIGMDASPVALLDVGLEAIFKKNNYANTILGRTDDKRQEYYLSLGYGDPKALRGLVFGDVEIVEYNSQHRSGTGGPDPANPPTTTTFNWTAKNRDKSWQVGVGLDWLPLSRFTIKSSAIYAQTNGTADFTIQPGGSTAVFLPIQNFDNTRRITFNLRGVYEYSKQWELTAGYAYERYRYSDIGYDGTLYRTTLTSSGGVVTGEFSFQPYTANIFYGVAKYRF